MIPPITKTFLSVAAAAALCQSASAALIANWVFRTGTSADLISSIGGYALATDNAVAPTFSVGSISLDRNTGLFATGVKSVALPNLVNNATLYARLKFDDAKAGIGFLMGLSNATTNLTPQADFGAQGLTAFAYSIPRSPHME